MCRQRAGSIASRLVAEAPPAILPAVNAKPVFVVCPPRSGSTFVVALLDSHPRVAMTNEAAWVTFLRKAFLLASTPAGRWVDDGENLRTPGILPEKYTRDVAMSFLAVMHPFVAELFLRAKGPGARDWYGDKVMSLQDLQFASEWFPDAAFVQLVRDPRDMVASTYAFQDKQPAAWEQATFEQRVGHMDGFLRESSRLLAGKRNLVVRYEDLMADPVAGATRLFEFLGIGMAAEVRAYLEGRAGQMFASHGTSSSPQASIGRWRQDLDAAQQAAANAQLAGVLAQFGYER